MVLPTATAGYNVTISSSEIEDFEALWANTDAASATASMMEAAWNELLGTTGAFDALAIEPVFYGACASKGCAGVFVTSQHCVCSPLK